LPLAKPEKRLTRISVFETNGVSATHQQGIELSNSKPTDDLIVLADAPPIPGLSFRRFRGEKDYPAMVAVVAGSNQADQLDHTDTVENVAATYRHLVNCDPQKDMLLVEMNGNLIGFGRVWWVLKSDGLRAYMHFAVLLPEWRGKGIRRAMLRHNERRMQEIATADPYEGQCVIETWAAETETDWNSLLVGEGYKPVRYGFEMVRPNLDNIPDLPLPEGIEVRPALPEHYRRIWDAQAEAFQDHWGATEWRDEWFEMWQERPVFNPRLWQVAWDGDEIAGMILNFIDQDENREHHRKRGYTENISVRRPWRRRGLARALLARSLKVLKDYGMTEAALGVDAENISGALGLYESMGFRTIRKQTTYHKPLE
jgi:mycothiol synthase